MEAITRKPVKTPESVDFMAREWVSDDRNGKYHIYIFGCTGNGESVCLDVDDFTPYFYIKVPNSFRDVNYLKHTVREKLRSLASSLKSVKLFKKKDVDGFNNGEEFSFVRFLFTSQKAFKNAQYVIKNEFPDYRLYETKGDPMIAMTHIREILMSGWIRAEKLSENVVSKCQINATAKWKCLSPLDRDDIPAFITLSYDIECFSFDNGFPDHDVEENYITQIGNIIFNEKTKDYNRVIFVVGECNPITDVLVIVCKNEAQLLERWLDFVRLTDPDQIIGYNIDDFDWKYIWARAQMLGMEQNVSIMSRLKHIPSVYKASSLESNAYGYNSFNIITTPGIGQIDMLHWFRKNMKLDSYSLNNVSKKFLGEKKREVDPKQIFAWSGPEGTPESISIVADYCVQDTYLPIRLMLKFDVFINLVEMSKVTRVPFTWLITRGESIKVYSQVSYTARKENYLIPAPPKYRASTKFEGATVLPPEYGAYNEPICGLDFASLYPSIMIAWNLCPTTYVKDPKYLNIPGVEYKTFKWEGGNYTFVLNKTGLISGILQNMWELRKQKKKLMGSTTDPQKKKIYNGAQLALKVSMNSMYGDMGSDTSPISCKPISSCVTYNGRCMIEWSKRCAEGWYNGAKNNYADSLHENEIVYVKGKDNKEKKVKIKSIGKKWTTFKQNSLEDPDKKQGESVYKIKSKSGWTDVVRVIKHKTEKQMYKITTNSGTLMVTEDHPMFMVDNKVKTVKNCRVGDELLTVNY